MKQKQKNNENMRRKYLIISCILIILMQGIFVGLAANNSTDRNVIIGFRHPVSQVDNDVVRGHGGLAKKNFHIIPAIAATVPESKIAELKNDPNVIYVENDSIFTIADVHTDEHNNTWGVSHIGSQAVHDSGIYGTGVNISVLDTGIDSTHVDLKDNYKGGYNFVFNNTNTFDDNCMTQAQTCHGTHVSGTIAAEMNGIGVIGVAPKANIYALKVLAADGTGQASWIISGIQWAVDNKMDIISMSFAGPDDIAIHTAVDNAYNSGLLLVAAAGNTYGSGVTYPAGYDSVIAVAATDSSDQNATFSAIDPKIELAAPGATINSTKGVLYGNYGILSGTSMAAPHVTGVAALIYSTGIRDNKVVRSILDNTARDLGAQGRDDKYGYGLVDAQNAILGIPTVPPLPPLPPLPPTIYIPPVPTNLQNTQGKSWVNYTWNVGIGNNITDSYNVSANGIWYNTTASTFKNISTTPEGWANITVWAFNSSGNGSLSTGFISQNVKVQLNDPSIVLNLVRTKNSPTADSKTVALSQGNYTVTINNTNLSELDMVVYDNGKIRKDLSRQFKFNDPKTKINYDAASKKPILRPYDIIVFNLNVQKSLKVVFIPYGDKGTRCSVTIGKK